MQHILYICVKNQTMRKFILFSLLIVLFCSCCTINQGTIVHKQYIPARTLYASGVYNQVKEKYRITVEGQNQRDKTKKVKIYVSKSRYDSIRIGDYYEIPE